MQIVYISNRPEILLETLEHVALFMPFVDQAVVCAPDQLLERFKANASTIPLQTIAESSILSEAEVGQLSQLDHQRRNYLLRTRLAEHNIIDSQFIMSDDDARPLKLIELTRYFEGERYHRYFFYDLRNWNNNQTEFDAGQLSTCAVLEYLSLPQLSYASHMPQIIDRELFLEAAGFFKALFLEFSLCEWSTYFNYACSKHPERFHKTCSYMTLCWPEHTLAWKQYVQPNEYLFENYTPTCYAANRPFDGLQTGRATREQITKISIEKIIQWRRFSIACSHPEQSKSLLKYFNPRTWVNKVTKHIK